MNGVFAELFKAEDGGQGRSAYSPLEADRLEGPSEAVVVLGTVADEKLNANERREREAGEIARVVTTAVSEGWLVHSEDGDRPAGFGDIVILVTRRTGLAQLEAALDAGDIPFRADSPSLILRSAEVRDLLACLRAVDSPGDEAALIAALRTPLLAVGDDDLLRFRRAGGKWRIDLEHRNAQDDRVVAAIERLAAVASEQFRLGVVGTLEKLACDLHAFELAATTHHAEESLRRLRFIVSRANAFVESGGTTISGFLEWIEGQLRSRVRSAETAVGDGDDSVRILTVHTAKGLEFPIVILAELGAEPSWQRFSNLVLFSEEGRPEVRIRKGIETPGFAELLLEETRQADLEAIRLCYVAMTRAKDHLVVSLHRSIANGARPSLAERVAGVLDGLETGWTEADRLAPTGAATLVSIEAGEFDGPAGTRAGLDEWTTRRKALVARGKRRTSIGASELDTLVRGAARIDDRAASDDEGPPDPDRWRSPRAASAVGRAVHGVLQRVDLESGAGLDDLARLKPTARAVRRSSSASVGSPRPHFPRRS